MRRLLFSFALCVLAVAVPAAQPAATLTAIRAGRLLDPEAGRILTNQVILVEGTRIREVGPNVAIPAGAQVIDLSAMTVMPGLVEAHNHLALTYKPVPENNIYYYTYVQESTALRAIQAASNGIQMLASGFTIVRDMGNNGNYADTALRQAIEQGWIPGPTIINSGIIIGGMGGQFFPTPEMAKDHNIVYPGVSRRRHARRDRQGDPPEHPVRREGDQDLRRLQAVRLHRRRDPAGHPRGGEVGHEGRGPRADAERRAERDRGRHLVDRAFGRAQRRDAQADGAEGHLARRHRDAARDSPAIRCRRRRTSARSPA